MRRSHTLFHHGRDRLPRQDRLWRLYQHHVAHHRFHECCFGVTTTLWDRVFGMVRAAGTIAATSTVAQASGDEHATRCGAP